MGEGQDHFQCEGQQTEGLLGGWSRRHQETAHGPLPGL